jgi:hypothetical protein
VCIFLLFQMIVSFTEHFCRVYDVYVNRLLINMAEIVCIGEQSVKLVFTCRQNCSYVHGL